MANVDRPNGFRPVKTLSGRPVNGVIRTVGVTDGADLFVGDVLELTSGLANVAATDQTNYLGVAVGFGKVDADGIPLGPYNPDSLGTTYYDDSASTHTEWVVYYAPANDCVFEAQFDEAPAQTPAIGQGYDIAPGAGGSTVTGKSSFELDGTTGGTDCVTVEITKYPDNDPTLIYGRLWVIIPSADQTLA